MNILFVFYNYGCGINFHGGIQILSALSKREGHNTKLLHFHEKFLEDDKNVYLPIVKEFKPDLIACTATDFEYSKVNNIARELKREFAGIPLMLGGKSAIEIATKNISDTPFDIYSIGEGEIPFIKLLKKMETKEDYSDVNSFWFKKENQIIKNPIGENVLDLDSLPFPDYDLFRTEEIIDGKGGWVALQFSRGCVYNCTFCFVTADKHLMYDKKEGDDRYGMDRYLRNNSVDFAMRWMEFLANKYPNIKVFNLDDELPVSIEMDKGRKYAWWLDFCKQYKTRIYDKFGIKYCANSRINLMNEEIIKAMVDSGCFECRMGFESGSYRLRKEIFDKPITDEKMREVYALCNKHGLRTTSFTMIGIPTETEEEVWKTINMTAELKPSLVRLAFCYPFENTKLWFYAKENNLIKEERLYQQSTLFEESVFKLLVPDQKIKAYRNLFPWYVNTVSLSDQRLVDMYQEKISECATLDFKDPKSTDKVKEVDKDLSEQCGESPHFCYFGNGYVQYKYKTDNSYLDLVAP